MGQRATGAQNLLLVCKLILFWLWENVNCHSLVGLFLMGAAFHPPDFLTYDALTCLGIHRASARWNLQMAPWLQSP